MSYKIESDFYASGLRCVVLAVDVGYRCGYVEVNKNHPLFKVGYSQKVEVLDQLWEKAKEGPIGKRGIIPIFLEACSKDAVKSPQIVFDVHGSLTYSGGGEDFAVKSGGWWFGFDCAHAGDGKDVSIMSDEYKIFYEKYPNSFGDIVRTKEYVENECRKLAEQLASLNVQETV